MKSNFDFLKDVDGGLFDTIIDAEKLFRDEYLCQCCVQIRVFAEKTSKKILKNYLPESTFDDIINCLKDRIKTDRDKEFVEDLFFIKREGNKCAHGEETSVSATLEALRRAFEVSIYYCNYSKKSNKFDKLQFDETLLVTGKPLKEERLVDKYVKLATAQKEELLNSKQGEFNSSVEKTNDGFRDENYVDVSKSSKKKKKELTPVQKRIKEKVKLAKKNIKENINNDFKKSSKKVTQKSSKRAKTSQKSHKTKNKNNSLLKYILFLIFVTISLFFLTKMIFFF